MSWNYRVIKSYPATAENEWYSIHEVYYDDEGKITAWTEDAIAPESDTLEGLRDILGLMRSCLFKPVLHEVVSGGIATLLEVE